MSELRNAAHGIARAREGGQLAYAGGAMVTLANPDRERFWRNVERLASDAPVGDAKPAEPQWLRPEMRVLVRYLKGIDKLRHATSKALVHEAVR